MPVRKLPPIAELLALVDAGLTQQQIADTLTRRSGQPISRSAVSVALSRAGRTDPKPRYDELLPWRVKREHLKAYPAVMLRALGRRRAGQLVPADVAKRLDSWLVGLGTRDEVVSYDQHAGFSYVARRRGDDVIRRPNP